MQHETSCRWAHLWLLLLLYTEHCRKGYVGGCRLDRCLVQSTALCTFQTTKSSKSQVAKPFAALASITASPPLLCEHTSETHTLP